MAARGWRGIVLSMLSFGRTAAVVGGLGVLGLVGLGVGIGAGAFPGHTGEITITVPGAMNLAVHCGGDETFFADGEQIRVLPVATMCDIEAPLSPVMPVRGTLEVDGWSAAYVCRRDGMELDCGSN